MPNRPYMFITEKTDFIESEFFRRELGIVFQTRNPEEISEKDEIHAILTSDLNLWQQTLRYRKPKSLAIFLTGNENYHAKTFALLDEFPCIKFAFVQYLAESQPRIPFKYLLSVFLSEKKIIFRRELWGALRRARSVQRGIKGLKLITPTKFLPLGYTNRFVDEFKLKIELKPNESLLGRMGSGFDIDRICSVVFMGQRGSWYRRRLINYFTKLPESRIMSYAGWGGNSKSESSTYIDLLLKSHLVLCPPGNLSNETPRYYEAMALGKIPIISSVSVQDWNDFSYWTTKYGRKFKDKSPQGVYQTLSQYSSTKMEIISQEIFKYEKSKLEELRSAIDYALKE